MKAAVLIATKDGAGTIMDTLNSVLAQCDVYLVSDGSTDDTVFIAQSMGAQVLHLDVNIGKPAALFEASVHFDLLNRYDALAILDDDTIVAHDFMEEALKILESGNVAIAVGKTITNWSRKQYWNPLVASRAYSYWRYQAILRRAQSAVNSLTCISGSNSVYTTAALREVLVRSTPYIVDDTYWTLEVHRRQLGRITYAPKAKAWIQDPTNLKDWYKQNIRWLWGSFQGIVGHKVLRKKTWFDFNYGCVILDWIVYVLITPVLFILALFNWSEFVVAMYLGGYLIWSIAAAVMLRKWQLIPLTPALIVIDWIYRIVFLHALIKTIKQPTVDSCKWESPKREVKV